jgi:hypothetical protein
MNSEDPHITILPSHNFKEIAMARCSSFGRVLGLALPLLILSAPAYGKTPLKSTVSGKPELKAIDVISFGPDGVLFIGDGRGAQVVAVDTGDTTQKASMRTAIEKIDEKLAGRIGTTPKGIEILHLAVNPASGVAYIALRKQDDKTSLILTVDGTGKIEEFGLDNVKYARVALPAGEKAPLDKITDIAWAEDRLLVAGRANEQFGSKIYSIAAPLENEAKATISSTETYHVAHGRWETKAPMETILPYQEDGKRYLVGAFTCTPLVKYPLDEIKPDAKVKGISMVELGQGNVPQDMLVYEKNGHSYVLVNTVRRFGKPFGNSPYWTARVDLDLLRDSPKINKEAIRRLDAKGKPQTDRIKMVDEFSGVVHMDRLDNDNALVLRTDSTGSFTLAPLALP